MAKTLIDIDEEALRLAMAQYRTTTKVETVNRALRDVAERRRSAVQDLMRVALEISDNLAECDVRRLAWK
jgi:Arc/MetJ family transcription regulator